MQRAWQGGARGAKAIASPSLITKREYVNFYRGVKATEEDCWLEYCEPSVHVQIKEAVCA